MLSSYGVDNVEIQETNAMTNNDFLSQVYLNYAMTHSQKVENFGSDGAPNIFSCSDKSDGYGFYAFWNNGNRTFEGNLDV